MFGFRIIVIALQFINIASVPKNGNVTMIMNELETLKYNVSQMKKEMVPAEFLNFYLHQESAFMSDIQHQMNELSKNMTEMKNQQDQQQLLLQKIHDDGNSLRNMIQQNNSALRILYEDNLQQLNAMKSAQNNLYQELKQMSLAVVEGRNETTGINQSIMVQIQQMHTMFENRSNEIDLSMEEINKNISDYADQMNKFREYETATVNEYIKLQTEMNRSFEGELSKVAVKMNQINASITNRIHQFNSVLVNNITSLHSQLAQYMENGMLYI